MVDLSYRLPYSICSWWRTLVEFEISFFLLISLHTLDLIDSNLIKIIDLAIYPRVLSTLLYKTKNHQTLFCLVPNQPTWNLCTPLQYSLFKSIVLIANLIDSAIFQVSLLKEKPHSDGWLFNRFSKTRATQNE